MVDVLPGGVLQGADRISRAKASAVLLSNTLKAQDDMLENMARGHRDEGDVEAFRAMLNTDCDEVQNILGLLSEALQKFEVNGFVDPAKGRENRKALMAAFSALTKWKRF